MKPKTKAKPKKASKPKKEEQNKPLTPAEKKNVAKMVEFVTSKEGRGFVIVTTVDKDSKGTSRLYASGLSKAQILQTVIEHLNVDPVTAMMFAMSKSK